MGPWNQDDRAIAPPKALGDEIHVRYRMRVLGCDGMPIGTLWISMIRTENYKPFALRDWGCSATLLEEDAWRRRGLKSSSG